MLDERTEALDDFRKLIRKNRLLVRNAEGTNLENRVRVVDETGIEIATAGDSLAEKFAYTLDFLQGVMAEEIVAADREYGAGE